MPEDKQVECPVCRSVWNTADLEKSCGNCFACTGCEMWVCAGCSNQIIIRAPGVKEI
ncbi:MAG: hypothetical protein ACOYXB_16305 [Bacteroidota bacterium]